MGRTIKCNEVLGCGHEIDVTVTYCDSINRNEKVECSVEHSVSKNCQTVKIIEENRDNELCELQDCDKQILWEVRVRIGNHKKG